MILLLEKNRIVVIRLQWSVKEEEGDEEEEKGEEGEQTKKRKSQGNFGVLISIKKIKRNKNDNELVVFGACAHYWEYIRKKKKNE